MNTTAGSLVVVLLVGLVLTSTGGAVYFVLKEETTKCLTEDLNLGTKCALVFQTTEPRGNKMRIWLEAPNKARIFHRDHPTSGRYQFTTTIGGPYRICVRNVRDIDQEVDEGDAGNGDADGMQILGPAGERHALNAERGDAIVKLDILTRSEVEQHTADQLNTASRLQPHEVSIRAVEALVKDISSDLADMKQVEGTLQDRTESLDARIRWLGTALSAGIVVLGAHQAVGLRRLLEQSRLV